jgi:hypothetical protein
MATASVCERCVAHERKVMGREVFCYCRHPSLPREYNVGRALDDQNQLPDWCPRRRSALARVGIGRTVVMER